MSKVNILIPQNRVSECQQRVNDLLDLQLCREGVITAMKTEDFEKAAAHVHRFLAIDETTLKLTAGDVDQGAWIYNCFLFFSIHLMGRGYYHPLLCNNVAAIAICNGK